jgi:hypothetical protein
MPKKATDAAAAAKPAAKKTVAPRRTKKKTDAAQPIELSWDHVATRAYYIALESGGDPVENWLRAERELIAA